MAGKVGFAVATASVLVFGLGPLTGCALPTRVVKDTGEVVVDYKRVMEALLCEAISGWRYYQKTDAAKSNPKGKDWVITTSLTLANKLDTGLGASLNDKWSLTGWSITPGISGGPSRKRLYKGGSAVTVTIPAGTQIGPQYPEFSASLRECDTNANYVNTASMGISAFFRKFIDGFETDDQLLSFPGTNDLVSTFKYTNTGTLTASLKPGFSFALTPVSLAISSELTTIDELYVEIDLKLNAPDPKNKGQKPKVRVVPPPLDILIIDRQEDLLEQLQRQLE